MQKSFLKRCAILCFACALPFYGCISDRSPSPSVEREEAENPLGFSQNEASSAPETGSSNSSDPTVWDLSDVSLTDVNTDKKLISFTFDDAPARTLENILAVFAAFNEENPDCKASATVFFNGNRFDESSMPLVAAAYATGFELGNHTFSHYDLTSLTESALREEIDKTDKLLSTVDGKTRHLLRAPFGKTNDLVKSVSEVPLIDWTIDTVDWTGVSEDSIYRAVYDNRFSGAIVLMHDGYTNTVGALKRLLPDLKADGYQVVNVSQLAKAHNCVLQTGKTYIRARKQA